MVIHGTVVHDKGEGRAIGYPTANLAYQSATVPGSGVWICRALVGFEIRRGLAVVGMWTLGNGLPSVEAHLLDFSGDLYERWMAVSFVKKLRDLETFPDTASLVTRIKEDVEEARKYFRESGVGSRE